MLDVDWFKGVNDTYGHAGGDAVLTEIARRLAATRAEDLVARWGGEEFCVLLTDIGDDAALLAAAERLRAAIADEPVVLDDGTLVHVTASIGVGRPSCANERLERLVIAADDALYEAKRGGRNQVAGSTAGGGPSSSTRRRRMLLGATLPGVLDFYQITGSTSFAVRCALEEIGV